MSILCHISGQICHRSGQFCEDTLTFMSLTYIQKKINSYDLSCFFKSRKCSGLVLSIHICRDSTLFCQILFIKQQNTRVSTKSIVVIDKTILIHRWSFEPMSNLADLIFELNCRYTCIISAVATSSCVFVKHLVIY